MNEQTSEDIQEKELPGDASGPSEEKDALPEEDLKEPHIEKMSKNDLIKKVEELKNKVDENYDKYLRAQAEIDNILKRNKKEKEDWIKYSNETLIKDLLQVIDNLESAIMHSKTGSSFDALAEGTELTLKGLKDTLEKAGLKDIITEGKTFDPCFHHAVLQENDDNIESGKILRELQKGYTLNDRLIRPAMVVISRGKSEDDNIDKDALNNKVCKE